MDNNRDYAPPWWLRNGHFQSIYATISPPRHAPSFQRERITTWDDDFLDLDWSKSHKNSDQLVILSHGLEGHTGRNYITGMVACLNNAGLDCLAWNYRGCSGEVNRQLRMYHNGAIDDLDWVIRHALKKHRNGKTYKRIYLVGFSMGGNITLLYLGKKAQELSPIIKKTVVFSVPCDLANAAHEIGKAKNWLYMKRFLLDLRKKVIAKERLYPQGINSRQYSQLKNFTDFDNRYTAPLHGFKDAQDYWQQCSSLPWLNNIKVPTLLVSAEDDPFLGKECYPTAQSVHNPVLSTLYPKHGGHVGFVLFNKEREYWSEKICRDFLLS